MQNLSKKILNFDVTARFKQLFRRADRPFWTAFAVAFISLNLVFLYHGAHFLFGDHDWRYLKDGIELDAGLFEGRFSQFILINLLSFGEIVPIINNLFGFAGFALGVALLAKYWQIPHNKFTYGFFALFTALSPYILSFMYFAFLIIPVLSWGAFILAALVISERESTFSLKRSLFAIFFIIMALGGYPPVINLLFVALTARFLFALQSKKTTLITLIKNYRYTFLNLIFGFIGYKLCLIYFTHTGAINSNYYNLQITPFHEWGNKAILVIKDAFLQFGATLPFISCPYKICITAIAVLAVLTLLSAKLPLPRRLLSVGLLFLTYLAGLITLFLSTSLKETEFSPRIDFFGFMYAVAGSFAITLAGNKKWLKNLAALTAVLTIFISTNALFEAEKVWKLGYLTEMRLYKRIGDRFKQNALFNPLSRYIIVQGGAPSFRNKYYHTPYRHGSDDLLNISYVPGLASSVMWNYFSANAYADPNSYVYTFRPDYDALKHIKAAKPWAAEESVAVGGYWILIFITPDGVADIQQRYLP